MKKPKRPSKLSTEVPLMVATSQATSPARAKRDLAVVAVAVAEEAVVAVAANTAADGTAINPLHSSQLRLGFSPGLFRYFRAAFVESAARVQHVKTGESQ